MEAYLALPRIFRDSLWDIKFFMFNLMLNFKGLEKLGSTSDEVSAKLTKSLSQIPDLSVLNVYLEQGLVDFNIDPNTNIDDVINAVESLGCTYVDDFGPRDTQTL